MKNKTPIIIAVSIVAFPLIAFSFYQFVKHINTDKFLLSLVGFICALGCYLLLLLTFMHNRKKRAEAVRSI